MYDLEERAWLEIPDMYPARNGGPGVNGTPPLLAIVKNELYAADCAENVVRNYDKVTNKWSTVAWLPDMNGWGLAFRACGDQLMVIGGPMASFGGIIELNSWVPDENPPQWMLDVAGHMVVRKFCL